MNKVKLEKRFEFLAPWLAWGAVIFGSFSLFSYAILESLPQFISQALGNEVISQAVRHFILSATFCVFLGRLAIIILADPVFTVFRLFLLQAPLQVIQRFGKQRRRKYFKIVVRLRRYTDLLRAKTFSNPIRYSAFFAVFIFSYRTVGGLGPFLVLLFSLFLILASTAAIERSSNQNFRLREFWKARLEGPLNGLRQLALSTVFLFVSYTAGVFYVDELFNSAVEINAVSGFKVIFLGEHYSVLVNSDAVERGGVERWLLKGNENLELLYKK